MNKLKPVIDALKEATKTIHDREYDHWCNNSISGKYYKSEEVLKYEKLIIDITGKPFNADDE